MFLFAVAFFAVTVTALDPCMNLTQGGSICSDQFGYTTCPSGTYTSCPGKGTYSATINMTSVVCTPQLQCLANRNATASTLTSALGWVCGQEDCSAINPGGDRYVPKGLDLYCDFAFNEWFQRNGKWSDCAFQGAGLLQYCDQTCRKCQVKQGTNDTATQAALDMACGADFVGDCSDIQPGGTHYMPNTVTAHANWAMNQYYQAYRCPYVPGQTNVYTPCDFGGVAETVEC